MESLNLEYQGQEEIPSGYERNYTVDTFKGFKDFDIAIATFSPFGFTPPQLVLEKGVEDFIVEGDGYLLVLDTNDKLYKVKVNKDTPSLVFNPGTWICFKAGKNGMKLADKWTPPFKTGNLASYNPNFEDYRSNKIPREYRTAYATFTSNYINR